MARKWIIRTLSIAITLTIIAVWAVSHFRRAAVIHRHGGDAEWLDVDSGMVMICKTKLSGKGYEFFWSPPNGVVTLAYDYGVKWRFWGFGFDPNGPDAPSDHGFVLIMPFWFFTMISATMTWFAWRKTRRKPNEHPFPVEPSKIP